MLLFIVVVQSINHVWLFCTPWTVACQSSLPMGFPSKNTGVDCHFLLQGIFPTHWSNLQLLCWLVDSWLLSHQSPWLLFINTLLGPLVPLGSSLVLCCLHGMFFHHIFPWLTPSCDAALGLKVTVSEKQPSLVSQQKISHLLSLDPISLVWFSE